MRFPYNTRLLYKIGLFITLIPFLVVAQFPPDTYDYNNLVINAKAKDTAALTAKLKLGYYFQLSKKNSDSTLYFIEDLENNLTVLNIKQKIALYNLKGKYYLRESELDSSRVYFSKSLSIAKQTNYYSLIADSHNGKAVTYIYESRYEESMEEMLKCLDVLEIMNDETGLAMNQYNLGMLYVYTKNYNRAKFHQFRSLEKLNKIKSTNEDRSMRYGALCNIYLKEKKIDSAEYCISNIVNNGNEKVNGYYYFKGTIALEKNENNEAISYYETSIRLLDAKNEIDIARRLNKMAQAYLNIEEPKKALDKLKKADTLISNRTFPALRRKQDSLYYEAYMQLEDSKNSLVYLKKYQESVNKSLQVSSIQGANNLENTHQLKKSKRLLRIKDKTLKGYVFRNKFLSIAILIFVFVSGLFFVNNNKKRKELKQEKTFIEEQYNELSHTNLELNDKFRKISEKLKIADKKTKPLRYKRSSLSEEQRQNYINSILNFVKLERPYLNSELTQKELADNLQIASHHLSEIFNINFGKNFYSFINLYRVEEAKRIIVNDTQNITMLAIAYDSGFNSKASFNRVFKEVVGVTPSQYKVKYS